MFDDVNRMCCVFIALCSLFICWHTAIVDEKMCRISVRVQCDHQWVYAIVQIYSRLTEPKSIETICSNILGCPFSIYWFH